MTLTVSMTVCHLYQNLEIIKGVRSLNERLVKVLIIAISMQSHSVEPPPGLGVEITCLSAFSHMDTSNLHPQTRAGGRLYRVTLLRLSQ